MKVEVKEVENKGFEPFKIEIEVETLEELKDLHARVQLMRINVSHEFWYINDINDNEHKLSNVIWREFNKRK